MATAGHSTGFHQIKEDTGTVTYGVPTGQGNYEIFMINYLNRYSALSAHLAASLSALTH